MEKLNIVSVIKLTVDLFKENCIEFESSNPDIKATIDRDQVTRIITNLIKNAIQSVPNGRQPIIKVNIHETLREILITISDNGIGIPETLKEKVFEPKFTTKTSGTGLGLGIVKNIIESYQGSINFTSEIDKGTTFTISLPKIFKPKHFVMSFENLLVNTENNIAVVTINRPSKLNALNKLTIEELHSAISSLNADKNVKVIILTGSGEKAFVAGADISEFAHFTKEEGEALAAKGQASLFDLIENLSTPVIAAINGFALGGGLELAMSCHFRIASDNARMGLPETSLGVIPGYGGTQRLPQLIGKGRAMEMIMTAGMIGTERALSWGLINHMVAIEELLPFSKKIADKIIGNSPSAIAKAIETVNAGFKEGVNGYEVEISAFGACFATEDFKEGTTAFLEKRKPSFKGN